MGDSQTAHLLLAGAGPYAAASRLAGSARFLWQQWMGQKPPGRGCYAQAAGRYRRGWPTAGAGQGSYEVYRLRQASAPPTRPVGVETNDGEVRSVTSICRDQISSAESASWTA